MARIPPPKQPLRHGHTTTSPHSTPKSRPTASSSSHTSSSTFSSRLLPSKATSLRGSRVEKYRDFFDAPRTHSHASSCAWNASYRSIHRHSRAWPQKLRSQASPLPPARPILPQSTVYTDSGQKGIRPNTRPGATASATILGAPSPYPPCGCTFSSAPPQKKSTNKGHVNTEDKQGKEGDGRIHARARHVASDNTKDDAIGLLTTRRG